MFIYWSQEKCNYVKMCVFIFKSIIYEKNVSKRLCVVLMGLSMLFYNCSSDIEYEIDDTEKESLIKVIEKCNLQKSKAFNSLNEEDQKTFLESFVYDVKGNVISFSLDQEKYGISDTDYNELICMVMRFNSIYVSDGDKNTRADGLEFFQSTNVTDNTYTGNPPLVYKNKRNNNVGGCDKFKGSICVIRW